MKLFFLDFYTKAYWSQGITQPPKLQETVMGKAEALPANGGRGGISGQGKQLQFKGEVLARPVWLSG